MTPRTPIVRRFRDHGAHERDVSGRVGAIIRSIPRPPPLASEAHARVLRRLRLIDTPRWDRLTIARRPALAAVFAAGVVFVGLGAHAGIGRAVTASISWITATRAEYSAPATGGVHPPAQPSLGPVGDHGPSPPPAAPPQTTNPPAPDSPVEEARPVHRRAALKSNGSPMRDGSPLARESRLLAQALDQLRGARDYTGALATLAEYDARFPHGVLAREAALARLDALTALGQSEAALQLLESMDMSGPRATEMLVLRGELRANAGRHRDAIGDFDRALSARLGRALRERALYARASSRSRQGDFEGARRDLEDYAARFPEGPHAAEVRRLLDH
jgi:TolA-binding protein